MDKDRLVQLESSLRHGPVNEKKAALDALTQCPAIEAVPLLQRVATDSPDFLCRRFAIMGLGKHPSPETFQILQSLVDREPDPNVLSEIAHVLFDFGAPSIPILQQLFQHKPHWLIRQTILAILIEADQIEVLFDVIQDGLQDDTQTVRETAILALGSLVTGSLEAEALGQLEVLAEAPFWRDRWRAATALSRSSHPKAKALLIQLQQDSHYRVVAAALEAALPPDR